MKSFQVSVINVIISVQSLARTHNQLDQSLPTLESGIDGGSGINGEGGKFPKPQPTGVWNKWGGWKISQTLYKRSWRYDVLHCTHLAVSLNGDEKCHKVASNS